MFTIHDFSDLKNHNLFISHNIVSLSYTDLTKNEPSLPHSHQYTEIMLVVEGSGYLVCNHERISFTKGRLYFINPNTEHLEISNGGALKYYVAKVNHLTVSSLNENQPSPIVEMEIAYDVQQTITTRFMQVMEISNKKSEQRKTLLTLDLAYLYYYFVHILSNRYLVNQETPKRNSSKLQAIIQFISANYSLDLKVSELAKRFSFSHNNLIHHFNKELGVSPSKYIASLRIQTAKNLLANSDYSITQICTMCGFSNPSFFGKTFKSVTGISPSEYRKQYQS